MAIEIARYQFHSWGRKGISTTIKQPDNLGNNDPTETGRASINLPLLVNEAEQTKSFKMIGPGDIIGINSDMIVRTQPRHYITDFESNYLVFAEFYDEDFLWRYTPAAPKVAGSEDPTD